MSSSRSRICRLSEGWSKKKALSAARVKLEVSATAMMYLQSLNSSESDMAFGTPLAFRCAFPLGIEILWKFGPTSIVFRNEPISSIRHLVRDRSPGKTLDVPRW